MSKLHATLYSGKIIIIKKAERPPSRCLLHLVPIVIRFLCHDIMGVGWRIDNGHGVAGAGISAGVQEKSHQNCQTRETSGLRVDDPGLGWKLGVSAIAMQEKKGEKKRYIQSVFLSLVCSAFLFGGNRVLSWNLEVLMPIRVLGHEAQLQSDTTEQSDTTNEKVTNITLEK